MSQATSKPSVNFRLRVSAGDTIAVGPGKIALIEAIQETGSITAAAKSLGMSYRRAWMLVDQLTINDAAGAHTTLTALLIVVALAVVIVLPPLCYLLWLTQTEKWSRT